MAHTCGTHQGAGVTLARLQVNRDLRAASEERGEDERRRTRTRRGRRRVGGNCITCDSRARRARVTYCYCTVISPPSKARAVGHGIGFQAQRAMHPYTTGKEKRASVWTTHPPH